MRLMSYTTFRGVNLTMHHVRVLLRDRFADSPESAGIAIAAAEDTDADSDVLEELALAWYVSRKTEIEAAAALSGAITAAARRLSDDEIAHRTGLPLATIRPLTSTP